jgi:TonB family protein
MHHGGSTHAATWPGSGCTLGLFPTDCFGPDQPVLRTSSSFGSVNMGFERIVRVQGKNLAREILLFDGDRKLLSTTVDSITYLDPNDPVLTPSPDSKMTKVDSVKIPGEVAAGRIVKRPFPVYPQDAKALRISGTVVLQATVGMDGGVHDLRVVSTPWPSLAASALWAVSQWYYKPYLVNGDPVDVDTTVNVVFKLDP